MRKVYLSFLTIVFAGTLHAQNSCAEALEITTGLHTVDTVDGVEIPDPICAGNGTGATNGEWYMYQPTDTFNLTITTSLDQNAGVDTRVHLYIGERVDLICVEGDDDA